MTNDRIIETSAREIESAFADVPYPGDSNIAYGQDTKPSDGWRFAERLRGKHWRELDPKSLRTCALPFLTKEAFLFYLPGFMLAKLHHSVEIDFFGDALIYVLTAPMGNRISAGIDELNGAQRKAVKLFLQAVIESDPESKDDAQKALQSYWHEY